ncbi:MAG: imelysin family protein [Eisenbergiella sp.]
MKSEKFGEKEACRMEQSIEEVLSRLVAVEDAAQQMQDAVEAQKKELAAQTEEKKKEFDSMLEQETARRTQALKERMEQEKAQELEALREQTEQQLLQIQHKYDAEHDKISDEILQSMIRT